MLSPAYTQGEQRLLEMAELVESSITTYDQAMYRHACGTPACALGHYIAAHEHEWEWEFGRPYLRGTLQRSTASYFGLTVGEMHELFDMDGCGNAGKDNKRAAAYLRDFVARKVRARLTAGGG